MPEQRGLIFVPKRGRASSLVSKINLARLTPEERKKRERLEERYNYSYNTYMGRLSLEEALKTTRAELGRETDAKKRKQLEKRITTYKEILAEYNKM